MATRRKARTTGTRAAVYVRVSTERQVVEGVSLDDQRERLAAYCKLRRLEVVALVTDKGESAFKPLSKRPGGRKVLSLIARKEVDAVVVLKLDRAFRNAVDALQTVEGWDKSGVAFHIADMDGQSVDTSTATGKMLLTFLAGMAEFERNLTAERTTAALARKARNGDMRVGKPPFGWRYEGSALAEVPAEQATIAAVRELRAKGVSLRSVCAELADLGHVNRAGGSFVPNQVERMLRGSIRQMHAAQ